jgi:hypothetical protein
MKSSLRDKIRKLKRVFVIKQMISAEEAEQYTNALLSKRKEYQQLSKARFQLLRQYIYECFLIGGRMWVTDGDIRKQLDVFMKWLLDEKIERRENKKFLTLSS